MKFIFLLFTISLGGVVREKVPFEQMRRPVTTRSKRDLIGYNRQRNTVHQLHSSRFKAPDKNLLKRYNKKIAEYIKINNKDALRRFRKRLMLMGQKRRAEITKRLGY